MAILSITKEQFDKGLKTLAENTSKEFNVKIEEVEKAIEEKIKILDETSIDDNGKKIEMPYYDKVIALKRSLSLHFSKKSINTENLDEVYVYGSQRPNDFGKSKKIEEIMTVYRTNPDKAIRDGLCNDKGEVLDWVGFNKGKPINTDLIFQKTVYGCAVIKEKLTPIVLTLKGETLNLPIRPFSKIKLTNVGISEPKQEDRKLVEDDKHRKWKEKFVKIFTTKDTTFEEISIMNEVEVEKHINNGPLKSFTEETFKSIAEQRANKNYDNFYVKKVNFQAGEKGENGSTPLNIVLAEDSVTNDIDDVFAYSENSKSFTGWYNDEVGSKDEVSNAYIIGDSYIKNDAEKSIQLNIFGFWFPEKYHKIPNKKEFDDELKKLEKEELKKEEPIKSSPKSTKKEEPKSEEPKKEEEDYDDW